MFRTRWRVEEDSRLGWRRLPLGPIAEPQARSWRRDKKVGRKSPFPATFDCSFVDTDSLIGETQGRGEITPR
jgi:hypothetical protein